MSKLLEMFKPLHGALKVKLEKVNIDNNVFRMHYKASVLVMLVSAILVGTKEYVGEPIQCLSEEKLPDKVINVYCWIHPTFTLPNRLTRVGKEMAYPGVGIPTAGEEVKYHKYYQWVFVTLLLQAIFFYVPRYLWKIWEGGRLKNMIVDLQNPVVSGTSIEDRKKLLVDYLVTSVKHQNFYALRFFLCELLNFVNVVGQMFLMNRFLDGEFFRYGSEVMSCVNVDPEACSNPMARVFPKVTKCTFRKFGSSGSLETRDAVCVLAINIVNEKVYIFLWFWFIILATITGMMIIYRICVVFSLKLRACLLHARDRRSSWTDVHIVTKEGQIGDWFVLYQLSKNIDSLIFVDVVQSLAAKLKGNKSV